MTFCSRHMTRKDPDKGGIKRGGRIKQTTHKYATPVFATPVWIPPNEATAAEIQASARLKDTS
eukprot:5270926-Heterocapsa_arctica.AAC.1